MNGVFELNEDGSFVYKAKEKSIYEMSGRRCRLVNNAPADDECSSIYKRIIEESEHKAGDEVYVLEWNAGVSSGSNCGEMGWIVVFDVVDLLSKVLKQDVMNEVFEANIEINKFKSILNEYGIRYGENWIRID